MTTDGPKTEAEAAEAAATRRRWINLAEIVAVAGLLISGLALWNNYRERAGDESDKAAARSQAQAQARVKIRPRDDPVSLAARVLEEEHRLYPIALEEYCRALRGADEDGHDA